MRPSSLLERPAMSSLPVPPTYDDAALAIFTSALAIVKPPKPESTPRKFDKFNSTLRFLALNTIESQKFPLGSRGRNYSDDWVASKSLEVMA